MITCALTDRGIGMCFTTKPGKVAHTTDWNTPGHAVSAPHLNDGQRVALTHMYDEAAETLRGAMETHEKNDSWMKVVEDRVHVVATKAKHSRLATPPSPPQDA